MQIKLIAWLLLRDEVKLTQEHYALLFKETLADPYDYVRKAEAIARWEARAAETKVAAVVSANSQYLDLMEMDYAEELDIPQELEQESLALWQRYLTHGISALQREIKNVLKCHFEKFDEFSGVLLMLIKIITFAEKNYYLQVDAKGEKALQKISMRQFDKEHDDIKATFDIEALAHPFFFSINGKRDPIDIYVIAKVVLVNQLLNKLARASLAFSKLWQLLLTKRDSTGRSVKELAEQSSLRSTPYILAALLAEKADTASLDNTSASPALRKI